MKFSHFLQNFSLHIITDISVGELILIKENSLHITGKSVGEKKNSNWIRENLPNKVYCKGETVMRDWSDHNEYFPRQPSSGKCRDDTFEDVNMGKHVNSEGWKERRRLVELFLLFLSLKTCKFCRLGSVPLTVESIMG